jgi:hypothetical protein
VDELIYGETLDPNPHPINEIPLMRPGAFMESAGLTLTEPSEPNTIRNPRVRVRVRVRVTPSTRSR